MDKMKIGLIFVLLVIVGSILFGQIQHADIDGYLQKTMDLVDVPGMSVAVIKEGKIIFRNGYGVEVIEEDRRMTPDSAFAIGSITKTFTAIAIMQLVERGFINLKDKVNEHLPWFQTLEKEKSDRISIEMLLSNSSGLPTDAPGFSWIIEDTGEYSALEIAKSLVSEKLLFEPGLSFNYSNSGFILLGLIIEKLSGLNYSDFITRNILRPLGMQRSSTDISYFDNLGVLYGHLPYYETYKSSNGIKNVAALAAGSELRSTVMDMTMFMEMILNYGARNEVRIVSEESIRNIMLPRVETKAMGEELGYCLGLMSYPRKKLYMHGGQTRTMSSMMLMHPETKTGVIVLFNVADINSEIFQISPSQIANNILNIVNNEPLENAYVKGKRVENNFEMPEQEEQKYFGRYFSDDGLSTGKISILNENIYFEVESDLGKTTYLLDFESKVNASGYNVAEAGDISFSADSNGDILSASSNLFGYLRKDRDIVLENYKSIKINSISFSIPVNYKITETSDMIMISNDDYTVEYQAQETLGEFLEQIELRSAAEGVIIRQTAIQSEWINGIKCYQQIYVVQVEDENFLAAGVYLDQDQDASLFAFIPYRLGTQALRDLFHKIVITFDS
jgi:CubicO group peptidase (beta-lactamase class C family)